MKAHHDNPRKVRERLHISGRLVLDTPAHFGNGQVRGDALVDMTLLLDDSEPGRALIPGATIAGALRSYLRERLRGYDQTEDAEDAKSMIAWLFGPVRESEKVTDQSLLIVDDALTTVEGGRLLQGSTLRDGVAIEPTTGTAAEKKKFDFELLTAGTAFDLHFELALTDQKGEAVLPYLALALEGLERGEIRLGARKRRGFGVCRVAEWTVSRYRMMQPADLCAWLETPTTAHRQTATHGPIAAALGVKAAAQDLRRRFSITATFALANSSVLIRSGFGQADIGPDAEHLHAEDIHGRRTPVISGTSWAGVIRHRALRIARTVAGADEAAQRRAEGLVDALFGSMPAEEEKVGRASRVVLDETPINDGQSLYQTRVRIDRFTGGAYETALFEEAPVYGRPETTVGFRLEVRNPQEAQMGLLLLVLKDLWTGDLPVGGEASVGRGRLQGVEATLSLPNGETMILRKGQEGLGLSAAQRATLQAYVSALESALLGSREEEEHDTAAD